MDFLHICYCELVRIHYSVHVIRFVCDKLTTVIIIMRNNSLCAGSILLFSLWAPIFQQRLGYSQMQVNAISIAGELGMYLPLVYPVSLCSIQLFADTGLIVVFHCSATSVTS